MGDEDTPISLLRELLVAGQGMGGLWPDDEIWTRVELLIEKED